MDVSPDIRLGVPSDMDAMMSLAMMATEENAFMPPSIQKMALMIWGALTRQNGLVGIITDEPDKAQGAVLLTIGETWYSDHKMIEERAIFIHPEYRTAKAGLGKRLCQFSKRIADELEMPLIIGVLSNQRTQGKIRMYQREFGEQAGAFFLYGARTGAATPSD